jgi:hypothetical protein
MSNTTMFIGNELGIYYIKHSYMFRPLMLAIIRLYMNTYQLVIKSVPLATEPGISFIILTPMKILQRNFNRGTFVV